MAVLPNSGAVKKLLAALGLEGERVTRLNFVVDATDAVRVYVDKLATEAEVEALIEFVSETGADLPIEVYITEKPLFATEST